MPRLVVLKEVKYAGVVHPIGAEFDCPDEKHARMLQGFGKVKVADEETSSTHTKQGARYKRRDMRAQD